MAYVDFKITTWERIEIEDDNNINEVVTAMNDGKITTAGDLANFLATLGQENLICEILDDCSEQLSVELNEGFSTIVAKDDDDNTIFSNGIN